ncbi:scyllo-inositol 2-dehydrogenase (NAD(+)) [Fulvia fulva]|uniref:Scyllo-inositol 2-dehydrogenase (NAD(+)) n=1 Tax=Passalora fulva TaxID=5499 RepID=A0A9Q8P343_PASFU|nr:scyllo-inositol 2-dehydrogenase (NAD(+)) [Fulvia fulva]KAK4634983.1 scyllo-inositol 2-dehydrogenase (NAD(+)) [Fulvia fulva]KAK4637506.1 scyllo-inositol 2-dehydrogenase (NAD(+)) [Fulvia fulva]UJO11414.1 scyllo-inositol 2-dehydrogenase (NAD(+)) [Fulvia fulva]WPV09567.1 scyllo-inositol 2-dehydrogenase (NAD(+)) [Fulvia fulva]WPV24794.1 scyllo-inositol 2-dehydrogenase (NAD(+)) [Fulvia fulva]
MVRKLQVAVSGLGRMGARHALHFLDRTPRAELVAACDPDPKALAWAKQRLEPFGVKIYSDFDEMLKHEGLEAVVVAGITTEHAPQSIRAIDANKHVLCEKPLSTSLEICEGVVEAAKQKPELTVMCGFSRRFDASYRDAASKVESGNIGRVSVIRSQTADKHRDDDYFVQYAKHSGGIFVDANIHDIDLAFWYFGSDSIVKSVTAVGINARLQGLAQYGDVDNGVGIVEFWGGKIAYFYSSRMMAAGQTDTTEIIGTHGKIVVNGNPAQNLVEHHEATGIRRDVPQTYYDRFEQAFVTESNEFTEVILDGKRPPFQLNGAVAALKVGDALQESLRTGKKINFNEIGERIVESKARL